MSNVTYQRKAERAFIARLEDATRVQLDEAARTPALDVADLYVQLNADRPAALAQLAKLNLPQLTLQAHCMASYLNSRFDKNIDGEQLVALWNDWMALEAA